MAIKHSKKAYLRPFTLEIVLILRFHDVQDYADSVLIVVSDDTLICIRCIWLDDSARFWRGFCNLMILQRKLSHIRRDRGITKKKRLHIYKLNIAISCFSSILSRSCLTCRDICLTVLGLMGVSTGLGTWLLVEIIVDVNLIRNVSIDCHIVVWCLAC